MKEKIIEILKSKTFNTTDEAGNKYIVIDEDDFEDVANEILELFNTPSLPFSYCASFVKSMPIGQAIDVIKSKLTDTPITAKNNTELIVTIKR